MIIQPPACNGDRSKMKFVYTIQYTFKECTLIPATFKVIEQLMPFVPFGIDVLSSDVFPYQLDADLDPDP